MDFRVLLRVAAVAVTCSARALCAQSGDSPGPAGRTAYLESVQRLSAGRQIRLAVDGVRLTGSYAGNTGDSLSLGAPGSSERIPLAAIDTLWERGRTIGLGAIVGGTAGGVAFGLYWAAVDETCESGCPSPVVGAVVGAASGALLGAGVGALIHRWNRRYP